MITDNGPQFTAAEYAEFASRFEFHHVTSSPYHSRGNGKAESGVKTAKRLLKKARDGTKSFYMALLDHHNTPTEVIGLSPAQRLMSRRTRTLLPTNPKLLCPEVHDPQLVKEKIKLRKQRAKLYYDRTAKTLPDLMEGQPVLLQPTAVKVPWESGACLGKASDRSYLVENEAGNVVRRNRKVLQPAPQYTPAPQSAPAPTPAQVPTTSTKPASPPRRVMPSTPKASNAQQDIQPSFPQVVKRSRTGRVINPPQRLDI